MAQRKKKIDLDPRAVIFLELIHELWKYGNFHIKDIAEEAGVHFTTLYNWRNAKVVSPRLNTLIAVAEALGYTVELKRGTIKPKLKSVK